MAYGMQVYDVYGQELVFTHTPYYLFYALRINNLAAGTHNITIPPVTTGGTLYLTQESSNIYDGVVSLGGTGSHTITSATISGTVLTVVVAVSTVTQGITGITYSIYVKRA